MPENRSNPGLNAVHVCKNCGRQFLRSEMDNFALISGVIQCPVCGESGPLKIEIRAVDEKKPPARSDGES
jgi:DNA-directed RNA polymerase subunit RPC12/RpoP